MESTPAKAPLIQPSWLRVIVFVLVYIGANFIAHSLLGQPSTFLDSLADRVSIVSGNPDRQFNYVLLTLLASFLLSVLLVIGFVKYIDRRSVGSLGFEYRGHLPDAMVGLLLPVIVLGSATLILYANNNLEWTDLHFSSGDFLKGLFLMIAIAVGEEMVFRGYILNNLMQKLNRWFALAISAALFSLMHSNNPGVDVLAMINLFIGGVLLGINYIYTRNLWFSIFLHTLWNFMQGPVLGFPVSGVDLRSILQPELKGNILLTGGIFGLEASFITGVLLLLTILVLYLVYQNRSGKRERPMKRNNRRSQNVSTSPSA